MRIYAEKMEGCFCAWPVIQITWDKIVWEANGANYHIGVAFLWWSVGIILP